MNSKRLFVQKMLENGVIAKLTAMVSIVLIIITLSSNFDCITNSNVVLPILSGVLCSASTFLYVKKDKRE